MAGVAGDFAMALEIILVQREHHFHHVARDLLGFLVVLFEVTFDVAEATFDAERRGDELHRGNQLPGRNTFKDFDIFVHLLGGFCGFTGRGLRRRWIGSRRVVHGRFDFASQRVSCGSVAFLLIQAHQRAGGGQI